MDAIVEKIVWTDSATKSFDEIVNYLIDNWPQKAVSKFVNRTFSVIDTLIKYPKIGRPSLKRKNTRISILNRYTSMVYHYNPRKKQIVILLFWNIKRNPADFKY